MFWKQGESQNEKRTNFILRPDQIIIIRFTIVSSDFYLLMNYMT